MPRIAKTDFPVDNVRRFLEHWKILMLI